MGAAKNNMIWDQEVEAGSLFDENSPSSYLPVIESMERPVGFVRKLSQKILQWCGFLLKETK